MRSPIATFFCTRLASQIKIYYCSTSPSGVIASRRERTKERKNSIFVRRISEHSRIDD